MRTLRARLFLVAAGILLLNLAPRAAGPQSFIYVGLLSQPTAAPEVLVVDASTLAVVTRIPLPVASSLRGMAVSPNGKRLYVLRADAAGRTTNPVLVEIDLERHAVARTIASDQTHGGFGHLAMRSDGLRAYSSVRLTASCCVGLVGYSIDGGPLTLLGSGIIGRDVLATPAGQSVFFSSTGSIIEYDTNGQFLSNTTSIAPLDPTPLAISPDGQRIYYTDKNGADLGVLGVATKQVLGRFIGGTATRIFAGLGGKYIYSALDKHVRVFDAATLNSSAVLDATFDDPVVNVVASEDESRIFAATARGVETGRSATAFTTAYTNRLVVVDRATGLVAGTFTLPDSVFTASTTASERESDPDGVTPMAVTPASAPRCSYRLSHTSNNWGTAGGSNAIILTTPCSWVASTDAPWVHLNQGTTSGASSTTIFYRVDSNTSGAGRSAVITIAGQFFTVSQAGSVPSPPFGLLETPTETGGPLTGSVGVTGWALDDVAVTGVQVWRDPHPSDPPAAIFPSGPQAGKIYIGNGTFVDGARPDVAAAFATTPHRTRGGWGYLMLTRGLVWDGQGPFRLYAYATDFEGNVALLGSKLVTVDNRTATKPFGAIDTPAPDATVSGSYNVVGWVLTPNTGASIPASGVRVGIDGVLLPDIPSMFNRSDITGGFPGFNTTGAGRSLVMDTTKYADGLHTIGFIVTDSSGQSDGVGGRFFRIDNSAAGLAAAWARLSGLAASRTGSFTSR